MKTIFILLFSVFLVPGVQSQDTIQTLRDTVIFSGQVSAYTNFNNSGVNSVFLGGRYIPELGYSLITRGQYRFHLETSLNIWGTAGFPALKDADYIGDIDPHRVWMRFSGNKFELRAGLQKINFGSAMMLRPLMWFDSTDPRDPLQLTSGVWGLLCRYYFRNNSNIWLWALYGNTAQRGFDIFRTTKQIPETGARIQFPFLKGETGLTGHYRKIDIDSQLSAESQDEWRAGIDGRWDVGPGIWFEATFTQIPNYAGTFKNREMGTIGTDYTFGLGNGLLAVYEHLVYSMNEKPFAFNNTAMFSALSLSYPLSLYDNVSLITYYDYKNKSLYNFLNWKHTFTHMHLHVIGYLNPENNALPLQPGSGPVTFGGKGVLIMLVYHHASK